MKKFIVLLILISFIFTTFNISVYASNGILTTDSLFGMTIHTSGNYKYVLNGVGKAYIIEVTDNSSTELTLPTILDGHPVIAFWGRPFENCKQITKLIIPDGILGCNSSSLLSHLGEKGTIASNEINKNTKLPENIQHIKIGKTFTQCDNIDFNEYKHLTNIEVDPENTNYDLLNFPRRKTYFYDSSWEPEDNYLSDMCTSSDSFFMEIISLFCTEKTINHIISNGLSFSNAPVSLKNHATFMRFLLGKQYGAEIESIIKHKDTNPVFNNLNNQYDNVYAIPSTIATELNITRKLRDLENYNSTNDFLNSIKDFVTLLGYRTYAEESGGYPDGYLSVAEKIGLTDGIKFDYNSRTSHNMLFMLAKNALTIPLCLSSYEQSSGQRDPDRLRYTDSQKGEICNGKGSSGKYETLLSLHFDSTLAEGVLYKESDGYKYKISNLKNTKGAIIKNTIGNIISVDIGEIPFEKTQGKICEAIIQLNKNGNSKILGISTTGSLIIIAPDGNPEGYSTINNMQGTGTDFIFTAITSPDVKEISLLADKFNGLEWHEITFDYLKQHYHLQSHINNKNEKVWTCRFGINDSGYRTFKLKIDGTETTIQANVNVIPNITVFVNGNQLTFDTPPQVINGRTLVPVRAIFEALGASVEWNGELQKVFAKNDNHAVELTLGETTMNVWHFYGSGPSGWMYLDCPAIAINGRTLVPIRAIAESFNCVVDWNNDTRQITINSRD